MIDFERQADVPLYRSLADAIKSAILQGRLRPGEKIPSVRTLCELADVSRNTAHQCYQTLISEGYITSVQGKGVFVSKSLIEATPDSPQERQQSVFAGQVDTPMISTISALEHNVLEHQNAARALHHQMPSLDDLPLQTLKRALAKQCKLNDPGLLAYTGDPFGHPRLREAIANYVLRARGIKCSADQVVVTSRPSQQMLDLYCRIFLRDGDWVAVEHPGYSQPRQIFELHGARIVPIEVDDCGLQVDVLSAMNKPIKMVYVTPSHQDPSGAILSLPRRKQLVEWACKNDATIWEDDVDNEYRYGTEPLPALYALDQHERVIYQSTFWRTLCPLIRLGFVILPADARNIVYSAKYLLDRDLPILEQLALADLIEEGHFERHIREMRRKFTARRQTAVHALTLAVGDLVTIHRTTSGLHLRLLFDQLVSKELVLRCGRDSGLSITGTQAYYMGEAPSNEYLVQFAHVDENRLKQQIELFAAKLKSEMKRQAELLIVTPRQFAPTGHFQ